MTEPVLSLDHVSKRFGSTLALSDMSLALFQARFMPLLAKMVPANRP